MSQFEEKQIEREEIFDGAVLHVVKDKVLLPDGNTSYREFCLHKGARENQMRITRMPMKSCLSYWYRVGVRTGKRMTCLSTMYSCPA